MRKVSIVLAFCAIAAALGFWRVASQNSVPAAQVTVGSKVGDLPFTTLDGKPASLYHFAGQRGTLLIFVATRCPVSNDYNQRMAELARDYTARGFAVIGDRKSTRLNSSHGYISYAVFCLKKKKTH